MSEVRDELIQLIGQLPEAEVSALLSTARALDARKAHGDWPWPPAFFGSIENAANGCTDNASRVDEILAESGFGQDYR
jgi:hypothetical protein